MKDLKKNQKKKMKKIAFSLKKNKIAKMLRKQKKIRKSQKDLKV